LRKSVSVFKEVSVAQREGAKEDLRRLAAEVVDVILEDEALVGALGDGLFATERKKCPSKNVCTGTFRCPKPFNCPKVHTVTPPKQVEA
jgi:hypothetical protein